MSKLEAQIRRALANADESDPAARERVYRAAFKAAERFQPSQRAHFEKLLVNTIAVIESEYITLDNERGLPDDIAASGPKLPPNPADQRDNLTSLKARRKVAGQKSFLPKSLNSSYIVMPVAGILLAGILLSLFWWSTKEEVAGNTVSVLSENPALDRNMEKLGIIHFGTDIEKLTVHGTAETGYRVTRGGGILVFDNTNFFANEVIPYEEGASYFGQLKLRLGDDPGRDPVLPVVFAGVQNLDADGNGLLQNDALSSFVHTGRLALNEAAKGGDGSYSWSGVLSPDGSRFDSRRPKSAAAFKLFAGVAFEGSTVPVELVTLTLFKLP